MATKTVCTCPSACFSQLHNFLNMITAYWYCLHAHHVCYYPVFCCLIFDFDFDFFMIEFAIRHSELSCSQINLIFCLTQGLRLTWKQNTWRYFPMLITSSYIDSMCLLWILLLFWFCLWCFLSLYCLCWTFAPLFFFYKKIRFCNI